MADYQHDTNEGRYRQPWSKLDTLQFYTEHRSSMDEIYQSELYFLSRILQSGSSVLDVGCAAGGFSNIFKQLDPSVRYAGADISKVLIQAAESRYPGDTFLIAEGSALPFKDTSFDIVFCSGVLHMALSWREILKECWRVANKYVIFDLRLTREGESIENGDVSYHKVSFDGVWDGSSVVPYIILTLTDACAAIRELQPSPATIDTYGYFNGVSEMAVTPYLEVCMGMWCLGKEKREGQRSIWKLPISMPDADIHDDHSVNCHGKHRIAGKHA